jgi:predicted dehydrogenase
MTAIKIGLVGIGAQMKENLLPSLLQMPDVRIVAACDTDRARVTEIHRFVPGIPVKDSVVDLLKDIHVDALVMAGPPQMHREAALLAMQRGVAVFVEKPPCSTLAELEELVDVANRHGVVTGVGMNFKFAKPIRQLREMTTSREFGDTLFVQLNHYANKPRTPLWGLDSSLRSFLLAQAIHTIDLAVTFGRGELIDVRPRVQRHNDGLIINGDLTFSSGVTASLLSGTTFPYFEFQMKVVSSTSTMVELDNLWNMTVHEPEHGTNVTGVAKRWRGTWQPGPLDSGYERSGYYGELLAFFDAVRARGCFEADYASLLPTYRVIEAICREETESAFEGLSLRSQSRSEQTAIAL